MVFQSEALAEAFRVLPFHPERMVAEEEANQESPFQNPMANHNVILVDDAQPIPADPPVVNDETVPLDRPVNFACPICTLGNQVR